MTQEDKHLLLQDLCTRLPYGVKVQNIISKEIYDLKDYLYCLPAALVTNFKPYLRSMSSMTEEEYTKYRTMQGRNCDYGEATICVSKSLYSGLLYDDNEPVKITVYYPNPVIQDWLNKKMFDYRGLIDKGLALEAPEDMYK